MSDAEVQAVFDKVIDAGYYPEEPYMCLALEKAEADWVIDGHEYELADDAIQEYIGLYGSMRAMLVCRGLSAFEGSTGQWAATHGVEFYRNWADRPEVHNADS